MFLLLEIPYCFCTEATCVAWGALGDCLILCVPSDLSHLGAEIRQRCLVSSVLCQEPPDFAKTPELGVSLLKELLVLAVLAAVGWFEW